jgi:hypothetical protein
MYTRRSLVKLAASGGLGLICLGLSGGCSDDSKTTGTQLQISPEVKAEIEDMKSAQKELRAERKAKRAGARGK